MRVILGDHDQFTTTETTAIQRQAKFEILNLF